MLDESIPLKIRQIINAQDATNNLLAISLLRSQLGFDFRKAFAQLKMTSVPNFMSLGSSQYLLSILDYNIYFLIDHQWDEASTSPYLAIERTVKQRKKNLPNYQKSFSILFFESENERDIYEALIDLPNLGEGLENLFF